MRTHSAQGLRRRPHAPSAKRSKLTVGLGSSNERPLRSRIREATREALLAAAEETIASRGLHNTRIEDIAAAAGVAVGTIYNYFADRRTLVEALLELRRRELIQRLREALGRSDGQSFRDRLDGFVRTIVQQFEAHRPLVALFIAHEMADLRDGARSKHAIRELVSQAVALVDSGVARGEIDPEGAEAFPSLLLGMVRGLISMSLYQKAQPLEPLIPIVTRVFCAGAVLRR